MASGTGTPPADRTAPACARASRSPTVRASQRSGCGIAVITPKSGQVPTTTTAPLARSRRTAAPSRRAEAPMPLSVVTSLAPIMMTAASGGGPATNIASTWPDNALRGGADNRLGAQPDSFAGLLGQPAGDQHAGHFVGARGSRTRWPSSRRRPSGAGRSPCRVASVAPGRRPGCTRRRRAAGRPTTSG